MKENILCTIQSFFDNPVFNFGTKELGRDEEKFIAGYISALTENGLLSFEDAEIFLEKLSK